MFLLSRLCEERAETVSHVVAKYKMHVQKEHYPWWHDKGGVVLYWVICKRYGFPTGNLLCEQTSDRMLENGNARILWDFSVQTDHKLEYNKSDIIIVDKESVQCPIQHLIERKRTREVGEWKGEIGRLWQCRKVVIIPISIKRFRYNGRVLEHGLQN